MRRAVVLFLGLVLAVLAFSPPAVAARPNQARLAVRLRREGSRWQPD